MSEVSQLINLLKRKEKLAAMLAPSFPVVYKYPTIITMLRKLGFSYITEVSLGARRTNEQIVDLLKQNPKQRLITTPCPTVVRFIKKQFPYLIKYLPPQVDSPMIAIAKIVREKYPGFRPIFIGPCIVKKIEANEDHPELNILVLTYSELDQVFKHFALQEETNINDRFDLAGEGLTRLYPVDGGLSHSSGLKDKFKEEFKEEEIQIVSGWKNCLEAVKDFEKNSKVRLLDILYCEGGCIGGPGIVSGLPIEERKRKVFQFWLQGLY